MQHSDISDRVLRALALNREGGFHFAGRFLDADFQPIDGGIRAVLEAGPHCLDSRGEVDLISLCIFFDVALGVSVRATLSHFGRMATTNINLRLNGVPRVGIIRAEAMFQGMISGVEGQFGLSRLELTGDRGAIGSATAQFAVMSGGTVEARSDRATENPRLSRAELTDAERIIMARADKALAQGGSFIEGFWGVECLPTSDGATSTVTNGAHVANRVGHLQGGIQLGIAGITTSAALGPDQWMITSIDGCYLRPGEGSAFRGVAEVRHRGRTTAVVFFRLFDERDRVILTATSTHARRA